MSNTAPKLYIMKNLPTLNLVRMSSLINENPLTLHILNRNGEFLLLTLYNKLNIKYCQIEIPESLLQ